MNALIIVECSELRQMQPQKFLIVEIPNLADQFG